MGISRVVDHLSGGMQSVCAEIVEEHFGLYYRVDLEAGIDVSELLLAQLIFQVVGQRDLSCDD